MITSSVRSSLKAGIITERTWFRDIEPTTLIPNARIRTPVHHGVELP